MRTLSFYTHELVISQSTNFVFVFVCLFYRGDLSGAFIVGAQCVKRMTQSQWSLVTFAACDRNSFHLGTETRGYKDLLKDPRHLSCCALKTK